MVDESFPNAPGVLFEGITCHNQLAPYDGRSAAVDVRAGHPQCSAFKPHATGERVVAIQLQRAFALLE